MKDLIEIFRMVELSIDVRISLIQKLGRAINDQYCMNLTEPVVEELVKILEDQKKILNNSTIQKREYGNI